MVETIPIWRPPFWQLLWRGLAWLYALAARRTEAPGCGADEARATPALRNAETALDRYGNSILIKKTSLSALSIPLFGNKITESRLIMIFILKTSSLWLKVFN